MFIVKVFIATENSQSNLVFLCLFVPAEKGDIMLMVSMCMCEKGKLRKNSESWRYPAL